MQDLSPIVPAANDVDDFLERWRRLYPVFRYWAWQFVSKAILGVIYLAVISEGLRLLIPALGQKLYKLPGFGSLREFEATYRLDMAPFFAVFLLVAVFVLWRRLLAVWLSERDIELWTREERLIGVIGCVILGADAVLFYYAMAQLSWGSSFSFSALIATAAYVGVIVFVSWMSIALCPEKKD